MRKFSSKSSDVRDNFNEMIDLQPLNQNIKFNVIYEQDEKGNYIASFQEITDLLGYGDTKEKALDGLINDLMEYSQDYFTDSFSLYIQAPNRREHLPYILAVMLQNNAEEIKQLIHVEY